jgi:hypothetical protein
MKTIEGGAIGCLVTEFAASGGAPPSKGGCNHSTNEPDIRPPCGFVNISSEMRMDSQHAPPLNRTERGRSEKCSCSCEETNHGDTVED